MTDAVVPVALAYEEAGSGVPLLLIHAFPLRATMWQPQMAALMQECRCIAPDLRGFGYTPAQGPYSMDQYADDVVALLDHLRVERTIVAGLSMGGYVAFALWRRHPQRIRALILADTRSGADSEEGREKRRELIEVARSSGPPAVAERQIPGLIGKTTRKKNPGIEEDVRGLILQATVDGVVGALQAMMERPDSTPLLPSIDVPTLVIAGDEDVLTPPTEARAMSDAIRGSRLEIIENAGHLANIERPAAFNRALSDFVGGLIYH